jgi:hypothetical protein
VIRAVPLSGVSTRSASRDHAKGPAGREIKDVAEASETFVRLLGMGNEADRLHNP